MLTRLSQLLCLAALAASFPAVAAESWECSFTIMYGSAKGGKGAARMEVDGNTLNWMVQTSRTTWSTFQNRLLENNDVGIVAASSQADTGQSFGPSYTGGRLIGASIITLDKSTGALRTGSVMSNGEHDLLTGHCDSKVGP